MHIQHHLNRRWLQFLILLLFPMLLLSLFFHNDAPKAYARKEAVGSAHILYLPIVLKQQQQSTRRVNIPYTNIMDWNKTAILWFGRITPTENYSDVRVGYNDTELYLDVKTFDRRIWYSTSPSTNDLTNWDTVALYLRVGGNTGSVLDTESYRFIAQFSDWQDRSGGNWQAAYVGNGSGWTPTTVPFTTQTVYRGNGGPNQNADNDGWDTVFHIPFSSLGLSTLPSPGTQWGMSLVVYDRDDAVGTPIPVKTWPETLDYNRPATWGRLSFGAPGFYTSPRATPRSIVTIKNGLDGAIVPDGEVGGWTTCGEGLETWTQWGSTNYAGLQQINIQNQWDVADWRCFAKYYVTFSLNSLPPGKIIISSTLTLYQFGNSGQGWIPAPNPSLIQVFTVDEDWNEAILTWNNAPLAVENVSQTWVDPLSSSPPWPGIPRTWDVGSAVASAYMAGRPLRMVLYSADYSMHSGKYFYTSDADLPARPTLDVLWGDP